jgi:hypothetical protein
MDVQNCNIYCFKYKMSANLKKIKHLLSIDITGLKKLNCDNYIKKHY